MELRTSVMPALLTQLGSKLMKIDVCTRISRKLTVHGRLFCSVSQSVKTQPWKVMFFGTDQFSLPHLEALEGSRKSGSLIDRLEVVVPESKFIKRRGKTRRTSPVWDFTQTQALPCHQWPLHGPPAGFDVGIIVSFGHLLPKWLIESFPLGILNVHPSLLPRWRGGAPIQHTIMNGDQTTGVSIMRIRPDKFDVGPILLQRQCAVPERSTTESLSDLLAVMGSEMLLEVLCDLSTFIKNETPQEEEGVTLGLKIPQKMAWVDWHSSVQKIDRLSRALSGQMSLLTLFEGKELRLEQMLPPRQNDGTTLPDDPAPGSVCYCRERDAIYVCCKDGWVAFQSISPIGRRRMTAKEFYNGFLSSRRSSTSSKPRKFYDVKSVDR
ncbi:methionyl-tRNA formyltransferase, mitochondrial-like [Diadema antillarum]|uniref:methionyl-tRNA formyltransferase, mitochondrial-like n=1 Tax=Diadema antillarum TaxID=105358 RepID=UPI003A83B395